MAGAWAEGLLAGCHMETHGVDLFGRDALLLGRLLTTLVRRTLLVMVCHTTTALSQLIPELLQQ